VAVTGTAADVAAADATGTAADAAADAAAEAAVAVTGTAADAVAAAAAGDANVEVQGRSSTRGSALFTPTTGHRGASFMTFDSAPTRAATHPPAPTTRSVRTLANGMRLLFDPMPSVRSVSMGVWVATGSANEDYHHCGVSHFLEHLFFKGTRSRSARAISEEIERSGGHINAFTGRDYTCVYVRTLDEHAADAIEVLADLIRDSQLFDFEKERNVILEEIASSEDIPEEYVHDRLAQRMWPNHPLGFPVSGFHETVAEMSVDDVRRYFEQWYRPGAMFFTIAGRFDEDTVHERVRRNFESMPATPVPPPREPPRFGAGIEYLARDIAQCHLCLGFPAVAMDSPRRYAFELLASALGGGTTSRLFDRIREREGLAYAIYSFRSAYRAAGSIGVYAAVAPENLAHTLTLIIEELQAMREGPMPPGELALNQEQLKGAYLMSLESTFNRMARLAKSHMYHGRLVPVDETVEAIEAITAEDVQRAARDAFLAGYAAGAVVGPSGLDVPKELAL
jgi:predicted Zn-dependent peptidase